MSIQARKLFAKRLRDLRTAAGISQEELAELAGVHRNYVGMLERAAQNPSLDSICLLASALKVRPVELLKGIR